MKKRLSGVKNTGKSVSCVYGFHGVLLQLRRRRSRAAGRGRLQAREPQASVAHSGSKRNRSQRPPPKVLEEGKSLGTTVPGAPELRPKQGRRFLYL
jgi:hypothetical protein